LLAAPADDFVAEFLGAQRGLRRLAVTPIDLAVLEPTPVEGTARLGSVPADASLGDALAAMLEADTAAVTVVDGGRVLGALTPAALHRTLRRSAGPTAPA
jgi:osmoprotectant transport system ATP-binding protein